MGWFGWTDRTPELFDALVDRGAEPEYASAFVTEFAKPLSKGLERLEKAHDATNAETRLSILSLGGTAFMACVYQAYITYKQDLMAGKYFLSPIELATVAILVEGDQILEGMDRSFHAWLSENHQNVCPGAHDEVFAPGIAAQERMIDELDRLARE